MKHLLYIASFLGLLFSACSEHFSGTIIELEMKNADGKLLLLEDVADPSLAIVDSAKVINGHAQMKVYVQQGIYRVRESQSNEMAFVYIDNEGGTLKVKWDLNQPDDIFARGNNDTKDLNSLIKNVRRIRTTAEKKWQRDSLSADSIQTLSAINKQEIITYLQSKIDSIPNAEVAAFGLNFIGKSEDAIPFLIESTEKLYAKNPEARYVKWWYDAVKNYKDNLLSKVDGGLPIGITAPEIKMTGIKGDTLSLRALGGQYILLDFWASWCQPCRKQNPDLVKLYQKYNQRKFTVFSVSLDTKKDQWQRGIEVDKLSWPNHVSDLRKWRSKVVQDYKINAIPQSYLIHPNGKIIMKNPDFKALMAKLDSILPAQPKPDTLKIRKDSIAKAQQLLQSNPQASRP